MAEKFEFLSILPEAERIQVRRNMKSVTFGKGDYVFVEGAQGDAIYLIDRGRVRIEGSTPTGRTATFAVLGEGSFFGELALVGRQPTRSASAISVGDSRLYRLTNSDFQRLRNEYPLINDMLLDVMNRQCRRLSGHLLEALFLDADVKIVNRLVELSSTYGINDDKSTIELTQHTIADISGVSRQELSKFIHDRDWSTIFAAHRNSLEITSHGRLTALAAALQRDAGRREMPFPDASPHIATKLMQLCAESEVDQGAVRVELPHLAIAERCEVSRQLLRKTLKNGDWASVVRLDEHGLSVPSLLELVNLAQS